MLDQLLATHAADLLPLLLAIVLGGTIGLERELHGRAAGLRTMILVCLGSTLVMLVSGRLAASYGGGPAETVRLDPARIAAGIVTGVGFLGAGVIVKLGDVTRGVTTAAGIWFVAGIGIALGDHRYALAVTATALALAVLALLKLPERWLPSHVYRLVRVTSTTAQADHVREATWRMLEQAGARLMDLKIREDLREGVCELSFHIRLRDGLQPHDVLERIRALDGVLKSQWR